MNYPNLFVDNNILSIRKRWWYCIRERCDQLGKTSIVKAFI